MIFPTDYRERMIKEEKSRQYKAMLDQQIRENNLIQRRNHRMKTEPIQSYIYKDRFTAPTRQLQHESTFLPSINHSNNIIDHTFKYLASPDFSSRRNYSNSSAKKYFSKKYNEEDLDDSLDRCLDECDQLINGINKNFIHLNNHLKAKPQRSRNYDMSNIDRSRHYSDFDLYNKGQDSRIKGYDSHLPVTSLRGSQLIGIDSDVGRNEMMNYNIHKNRQKQILHISTPGEGMYSPAERDNYENSMNKGDSRTKRKNINELLAEKVNTPSKLSNSANFEEINSLNGRRSGSKLQKQFTNVDLQNSMLGQGGKSMQKMKEEARKMAQQLKEHQEMKRKDNKILQHLRKAKNKGSILFKKIQVFRKQREQLQKGQGLQIKATGGGGQTNKIQTPSRNTQKNQQQSRNSYVSQDNNINQEVTINNKQKSIQGSKNQAYKEQPLNNRANSKVSQKE